MFLLNILFREECKFRPSQTIHKLVLDFVSRSPETAKKEIHKSHTDAFRFVSKPCFQLLSKTDPFLFQGEPGLSLTHFNTFWATATLGTKISLKTPREL